jgi:hypothetical protein
MRVERIELDIHPQTITNVGIIINQKQTKMQSVLLSGFDAFGNIDRNPTREIVEELGGNVLQVSTVHADRAVEEMCRLEFSVIVHLGVNANANTFNLEQFAYNSNVLRVQRGCADLCVYRCYV